MIRRILPEEFITAKWDGGITRQIAIGPDDAVYSERNFLWRISSADVELEESDFTPLPDYERLISVLEGKMQLKHDAGEARMLMPGEIYKFDGGWHTHSKGKCVDFNLMLRKGGCTGSLCSLRLADGESCALPTMTEGEKLLLFCVKGKGALSDGEAAENFAAGEALLLTQGGSPVVRCQKQSVFMAARIVPIC